MLNPMLYEAALYLIYVQSYGCWKCAFFHNFFKSPFVGAYNKSLGAFGLMISSYDLLCASYFNIIGRALLTDVSMIIRFNSVYHAHLAEGCSSC